MIYHLFVQTSNEYFYYTRCLLKYSSSHCLNSTRGSHDNSSAPRVKMRTFQVPDGFNSSTLPTEVDWRTMGAVSSVKDQVTPILFLASFHGCGTYITCYALSILGQFIEVLFLITNLCHFEIHVIHCIVISCSCYYLRSF